MPQDGCNCSQCAGGCILTGHPLSPSIVGGINGAVIDFPDDKPPEGSPKCRSLSEWNPTWRLTFTPIDPDDCVVAWFLDTLPGGSFAAPTPGGRRIYGPELVKANDCPVITTLRYNERGLQEGANNLFLRIFDGQGYSLSLNIGVFDPFTGEPSELIVDLDTPQCTVTLVQTTQPPDTSGQVPDVGDLPIGQYYVHFFGFDSDSLSVLPIPDNKYLTWEIWTAPHRGGDMLDSGRSAGGNITSNLINDFALQDEFRKLIKGGGEGQQICFTRYVHLFDSGCNESDTAFDICIEPFAKQLVGEYLEHVVQSTNHEECFGVEDKGPQSADDSGLSYTDAHPELNQFTAATGYYPSEDHGLWTYGSGRAPGGDLDSEAEGDIDESSESESQDLCHWVNIHIETAPPPTAPIHLEALGYVAQATCHDEDGDPSSGDYTAGLLTPPAGTVLDGDSQTFSWDAQEGATGYGLAVSSDDGNTTYFTGATTDLSITATDLPTDGSKLWVGFVFDQNGTIPDGTAWEYVAAGGAAISVTRGVCLNVEIATGEQDKNCKVAS